MDGPVDEVLTTLDGVRSSEVIDGRHVLVVEATTDVRRSSPRRSAAASSGTSCTAPPLTDLFREAVA